MTEIEIGGYAYRIGKIDARAQFHIVRRLAPALSGAATLTNATGAEGFAMLADAVAKMSDADADYVLFGLLRPVSRKEPQGLGWSQIVAAGSDRLMYDDIDLAVMMRLAGEALKLNMSGFFSAAQSALIGNPTA